MKHSFFTAFLLFLFAIPVYSVAQEKEIEIQQYDIHITYDVEKNQLECHVAMDILRHSESTSFATWFSDHAIVKSINCEKQQLEFIHNPNRKMLTFQLPTNLAKQKNNKISLEYLLPLTKDLVQNSMVFLTQKIYWCPFLPQTNAALKLTITTPEYYKVNAAGPEDGGKKESGKTWIYHYTAANTDMSFPLMISTQSDINTRTKKIENVTLSFTFLTAKPQTVDTIVKHVSNTFQFYQNLLGIYPYSQMNFIEVPGKDSKTIIQNNMITFAQNLVEEAEKGEPVFENLVASQWWGDGVKFSKNSPAYCFLEFSVKEFFSVCERFSNRIDENFETEMEAYKAEFNSKNDITAERSLMDIKTIESENDKFVLKYKGTIVIYYLARYMGDDIWREFFKEIYQTYKGKTISFSDFETLLKTYDTESGDILNAFQPLLTTTGMPEFVMPAGLTTPEPEEDEFEYFEMIEKESETTPPAE